MKFFLKIIKGLVIGVSAVILVTIGIDAADNYDNFSQSIVGRIIFNGPKGPCPLDMTFISTETGGFCIDKYESSPSDTCPTKEVGSQVDTRDNLDLKECSPVSRPGAVPWRFISQSQAVNACAKAGKRLPTSEEWYLASLGTPDREGNWGNNDCQVNSNWETQPGLTGRGLDCVSSAGAYDMVGNVWEWVMGEINEGLYNGKALPEQGYVAASDIFGMTVATTERPDANYNEDYFWIKNSGVRGIARGGYWDNGADAGLYSMYLVSPPSFAGTGVGFRCAKQPE